MTPADLPPFLSQRYQVNQTPCWSWTGGTQSRCYGSLADGARGTQLAHRAVWEAVNGPIPPGQTVDHLCRNKLCGRPDHLELVTAEENKRRFRAAILQCPRGHDYTPENTAISGHGTRSCRQCGIDARRRAREAAQ